MLMVQCDVCDQDIPEKSFGGHRSGHVRRGELPKRTYEKVHHCEQCDVMFETGHKLWAHKRRIHRLFDDIRTDACRKQRLLLEREYCCEICGLTEWQGQPAPLELDHIDGHPGHNTRDNLRLVCPNCHAQTPTHRGRNVGRHGETKRSKKLKRYYDRNYRG